MSDFNKTALTTLQSVSSFFDTPLRKFNPINSSFSVGIEIEVKFRHYFPELFDKYFKNTSWGDRSPSEQDEINSIIGKSEESLLFKLNKTKELGINTGNDCYWEFALDPVWDLSLIVSQIHLLRDIGVLPKGEHSLHMTIGNLKKDRDSYWVLMFAELLFSSRERLETGVNKEKNKTYFRKGVAGLLEKRWRLIECKSASELRSLEIVVDDKISLTSGKMEIFNRILNDPKLRAYVIKKSKVIFERLGLPDENWGNYKSNGEVWDRYIENFDTIKEFIFFKQIH